MKRTHRIIVVAVAGAIIVLSWSCVAVPDSNKVSAPAIAAAEENDRIIAELEASVEALERNVEEALKPKLCSVSTLMYVPVVVTAYNPIEAQTDSTPEITASNKRVRSGMVALSRDLEHEFGFRFGDDVIIEEIGVFVFEDRMNKRWKRRVDILMFSNEAAKKFGHKQSFLVVDRQRGLYSGAVFPVRRAKCGL